MTVQVAAAGGTEIRTAQDCISFTLDGDTYYLIDQAGSPKDGVPDVLPTAVEQVTGWTPEPNTSSILPWNLGMFPE